MTSRPRRVAVAVVVAGAMFAGALAAHGQADPTVPTVPGSTTSTSSTTTTAPDESSTTTTTSPLVRPPRDRDPDPDPDPGEGGPPESGPPPSSTAPPAADDSLPGDSAGEPVAGQPLPPDIQALINSVVRTRGNNTGKLLDALRPLQDLGLSAEEAAIMGMGRFPVAGYATFADDWWYPRFVPAFHLHEGTDIFAGAGTPVRSPFDGTLRQAEGPVGGLAAYIDLPDGGYVYMAHLASFVPGQVSGQPVRTGDVVGFVGDSGNAKGGSPHVHFEHHPAPTRQVVVGKGKAQRTEIVTVPVPPGTPLPSVNPKPHLDAWVQEAIAQAPQVIGTYQASRPRLLLTTGLTRRLSDGSGGFSAPSRPPRSQLLWATSANPSGGALALASARAAAIADSVDWASTTRADQARRDAWQRADARAVRTVRPLTPRALGPFLPDDAS